jgi:radical SAM superfamily enzyme YgiQ (UPF0313 family)
VRIAFVSGNREQLPDAVIPIGILSVMASTPARHETRLIDLCFAQYPMQALRSELGSFQPDLVAVGMRNLQNADYTGTSDQLSYYKEVIQTARSACPAPIVLGGSGFSVLPRPLMERLRPDFGISGEGEAAFPRLLKAIEAGDDSGFEFGALHRLVADEVVSVPAGQDFLDIGKLPFPDRSLLDPRYYERYGIESIQTKRGCPLQCEYCTYPIIEGRVGRLRDPAAVVDEMEQALLAHPNTRHFFMVDSVFNLPRTHAKQVCRELVSRGWSHPWTCYANPLGFDLETAELARAAGCTGMEVGSDSGVDHVLERLRKGFTIAKIRNFHDICKTTGIPDCHTFILGTRGETLDDVKRSIEFIVDLDPYAAIVMVWVDDYELMDPELRCQRLELREQSLEILRAHKDDFPYWVIPPLGVNFDVDLFRRLRRNGVHGPLWQHLGKRQRD